MPELGEEELRLLNEITQRINLGRTAEEVFELVCQRLRGIVPFDRAALALLEDDHRTLRMIAVRSPDRALSSRGYRGTVAGSDLELPLADGKPRILSDLAEFVRTAPRGESTRLMVREGFRSSLTLPLQVGHAPIGVVILQSRTVGAYLPEHIEFLEGLVGHLSIAVEKSLLLEELRDKTSFLENILEHGADAIIVHDEQDRISGWNGGARRMFGWETADVLGKPSEFLVPTDVLASGEPARLRERLQRDGYVKDYECVRHTAGGARLIVNMTCTVLRGPEGRAQGCSCILRDVTNLKRMEEDLVRSRSLAALGELAAMVAHEIKNPLAGISCAVQVLIDAIPASDSRRSIVGEILSQIDRLDRSVRDLLAFARPVVPQLRPVDLGDALSRAWASLGEKMRVQGVRFVLEAAARVHIPADPDLLNEVWSNLFQNAVEAMPHGGELRVRLTDGPMVRVEVVDAGTGMSPQQIERLFQPFHTTKTRGTGLGLAIARKIVEAHRGEIRVSSAAERGTTVTVVLPR